MVTRANHCSHYLKLLKKLRDVGRCVQTLFHERLQVERKTLQRIRLPEIMQRQVSRLLLPYVLRNVRYRGFQLRVKNEHKRSVETGGNAVLDFRLDVFKLDPN